MARKAPKRGAWLVPVAHGSFVCKRPWMADADPAVSRELQSEGWSKASQRRTPANGRRKALPPGSP